MCPSLRLHPSAGFLIVLSLTLFVVGCETLHPRPQVSYLVTTYLCWGAGALMLWAGEDGASGERGGASVGQGAEPGRHLEAGPGIRRGGPEGEAASRDGAGPGAGLRVQSPTPRSAELLKPPGHEEPKFVLPGTAGELPSVGLAAEPSETRVRAAVRR